MTFFRAVFLGVVLSLLLLAYHATGLEIIVRSAC